MKLLIVIVNYRSADLTIDCLRSLEGQLDDTQVIVTDNKSPDDSVSRLNAALTENHWGNWLTIMPLDRNGGFAYGNNAAIASALNLSRDTGLRPERATFKSTTIADSIETRSGQEPVSPIDSSKPDFILLLNPDTVVRPGAIKALLDFMTANPKVGIAGSRLEDPDGTPQRSAFRFHSIAGEFERGIRMGFVTRLLSQKMIAPPVSNETGPCDWVAGASMMVRREVFETAGLMDERYFMYFEEVDFCLTARRKGWPCWYVPASRVVHLVGSVSQLSDSRKHRARRPAYWFESRRRYFVKNHGWMYAALADLAYLAAHTIWRTRRLLQGKEDTDPPKLLLDSLAHSVFLRGWTV